MEPLDGWSRAGLIDPESNALDRPFPSFGIVVSEQVKLDAKHDRLLWNRWPGRLVAPPSDLLTRFVALGVDGKGQPCAPSGEAILAFARAYGPLDMWPAVNLEGVPAWERAFREMKRWLPRGFSMAEPLEHWRRCTAAMRAVLDIVALLRLNETPPPMVLDDLILPSRGVAWADEEIREEQSLIGLPTVCRMINTWMEHGGVRPRIYVDGKGELRAVIDAPTTFGELAVQLLQAVSSTSGWALCRSCGVPFAIHVGGRGRRPSYCDHCGPKARQRLAARRHYYKKREAARERMKAHGKASRKSRR